MSKCRPNIYQATAVEVVPGVSITITLPALLTTDIAGTKCIKFQFLYPGAPMTGREQVIVNIGGTDMAAVAYSRAYGCNVYVPSNRLRCGCPCYVGRIEFEGDGQVFRILRGLKPMREAIDPVAIPPTP